MIALLESLLHRATLARIAIQNAVQLIGLEAVGQLLRAFEVIDTDQGIVGQREIDALSLELLCQPPMTIAVELQFERTPRRHPQVTQSHKWIEEVKVVVQALARIGLQKGLARGFVVPGPGPRTVADARLI